MVLLSEPLAEKRVKTLNVLALVVLSSCMGARVNTAPVPELPTTDVWMRGTDAQAAQLSNDDEMEIISNVVRDFYRPIRGQVRWVSVLPLSHYRSAISDNGPRPDPDRAAALVRAIGLPRVCQVGALNTECEGIGSGGTLRFSSAYGVSRDTALLFVQYGPIQGAGASEIEFRMVRTSGGWQMASRRSLVSSTRDSSLMVAERLRAADLTFGTSAANTDLVSGLAAMFDDSVIVQIPGGFANGKVAAVASLRANADNEKSKTTWAPIRSGVSADGLHGFTYGYMTLTRPDGSTIPLKYLAYWVNRGGEWKVLAYKRRPRPAGEVSREVLAPSLPMPRSSPIRLRGPLNDLESLVAAEKAFSDTSQVIGIGPAFELNGRPDAMNMGGPTDTAFVIGNKAIARSVGAGYPAGGSPVYWAADHRAIVASSGDLGVTFGYIRPHQPQANGPQAFPFFTIWKREPGGPWRYIAE